ncbi:MAG: hypothetical protein K5765_01305 [Clostridia bacterium]|nr:hypothetical protein [Clostridia bacterium]
MKKSIKLVVVLVAIAMLSILLIACVPKTVEDARAKFSEEDYAIIDFDDMQLAVMYVNLNLESVDGGFAVMHKEDGNVSVILHFSDLASAKAFYSDLRKEMNETEVTDKYIFQEGNWVFVGEARDLKIFKQ